MTISISARFTILERDGFTCRYCGRQAPETQLEVDHAHSRRDGGADSPENLVTACLDCNRGKGGRSVPPPARREWESLVGRFFHTFGDDGRISTQGVVVSELGPAHFVIHLFDWMGGEPSWYGRRVVPLARIAEEGWALYATDDEMRDAYEHGGKKPRLDLSPNGVAG